jgi:hypothetical protein
LSLVRAMASAIFAFTVTFGFIPCASDSDASTHATAISAQRNV